MKNKFLFLIFFFIAQLSYGQLDNWEQVVGDGFGSTSNQSIIEFAVFNNEIYASTDRIGPGQAQLFKSVDGVLWDTVFYDVSNSTCKGIPSINSTNLDGGIMWLATADPVAPGSEIYRSIDGSNWTQINTPGMGDTSNTTPAPHMVLFEAIDGITYLYAGMSSHGGPATGEIWRIPYTSSNVSDWELVYDFDTSDVSVTQITYFYVWNSKLYFGTNGSWSQFSLGGGQIWESSDGVNFNQNLGFENGMNDPDNRVVACFVEFDNSLFVTTTNQNDGGHMYRSSDGVAWDTVTIDAFGIGPFAEELHNFDVNDGLIWITAYTTPGSGQASPIWKSSDGWNFNQSNLDGFGDINNEGQNPVTINFQNRQYHGGHNLSTGGQIWRTQTYFSKLQETTELDFKIYPNPSNALVRFQLEGNHDNLTIIFRDFTGKIVKELSPKTSIFNLDLSDLSKGLYFVELKNSNERVVQKLILF